MADVDTKTPLLEVKNLVKHFPITRGITKRVIGAVKAVDDISFSIEQGKTFALVGESGCGKTTASRCILRGVEPTSGEINFLNRDGEIVDVRLLTTSIVIDSNNEDVFITPEFKQQILFFLNDLHINKYHTPKN